MAVKRRESGKKWLQFLPSHSDADDFLEAGRPCNVTPLWLLWSWRTPKLLRGALWISRRGSGCTACFVSLLLFHTESVCELPTINIQFSLYCIQCGFAYSWACELFVCMTSFKWVLDFKCIYVGKIGGWGQKWRWNICLLFVASLVRGDGNWWLVWHEAFSPYCTKILQFTM